LISIGINWIWVSDTRLTPSIWFWKTSSGGSRFLLSPLDLLSWSARKKCIRSSWNVGWMWEVVLDHIFCGVSLRSISLIFTEVSAIVGIKVPRVISHNVWKDLRVSLDSIFLSLFTVGVCLSNRHWWVSRVVASMWLLSESSHVVPGNRLHVSISLKITVPFARSFLN
jgi:hypothetical protein